MRKTRSHKFYHTIHHYANISGTFVAETKRVKIYHMEVYDPLRLMCGSQAIPRTVLPIARHCTLASPGLRCRTPILKNWLDDNFEQHQPVMMYLARLAQILGHNLAKSTDAYAKLIGDSAGAARRGGEGGWGRGRRRLPLHWDGPCAPAARGRACLLPLLEAPVLNALGSCLANLCAALRGV